MLDWSHIANKISEVAYSRDIYNNSNWFKNDVLSDHCLRLQLPLLTFHMTFWIRVTQRTSPLVICSVEFYDFMVIDRAASCTLAWACWGHWQSLLKVLTSKVVEPQSQPLPRALTNTFMVNKLEITLSLPLVELVHLLSSYCKLTRTWQQKYSTESL